MVQLPKNSHSTNTSHVEYEIQLLIPYFDLRFGSLFNGSPQHGLHTQIEEPTEEAVYSIKRKFERFRLWWQCQRISSSI